MPLRWCLLSLPAIHAPFTPLPSGCSLDHKGCFVDPNPARLLKHGLPGCAGASPGAQVVLPPSETCDGSKMTPQLCAEGCYAGMRAQAEASGGVVLAGPENGNECFCDVVPEWSGKAWDSSRPLTPSKLCTKPCAGGKGDVSLPEGDMGCGGGWIIDVYVVDCGGDWGWWFLLLLALSALGYVGGSVAVNHKSRGMPLDRTALPHPAFWAEVRSLVKDGVAFTRARATGAPPNGASAGGGGGGGGGYEAVGDGGKGNEGKGGAQKAKAAVPSDLFVGVDEAEQPEEEQEEDDEDVVE